MTATNILEITQIDEGQAEKYLTHNEAVQLLEAAGHGSLTINFTVNANLTLTTTGVPAQWQYAAYVFTDTGVVLTAARDVVWPNKNKRSVFFVKNSTARTLTFKRLGQAGVAVAAGTTAFLRDNGTDIETVVATGAQPLDATLTALAAANWALNAVPVGSGADTLTQMAFAVNTFLARASTGNLAAKAITDFGLSLVDDADAAAARTTLGVYSQAQTDALVVGLWDDRGSYDASPNTYPATGGSGAAGAILKGDIWTISVAGTLGGGAVNIGDCVRALIDTPGQTAGNWSVIENNLGYVPLNAALNLSDLASAATARTNLGLGTGDTPTFNGLSITGTISAGGDIAVNGGSLTTTQATANLFNATATTVNIAGAATAVNIGASTGTITLNNALLSLPNAATTATAPAAGAGDALPATPEGYVTIKIAGTDRKIAYY